MVFSSRPPSELLAAAISTHVVKTRMIPPLSSEQAATLYDAMLADVLTASADFAQRLDLEPILHFGPLDARPEFERRAPDEGPIRRQRGDA